MWGRMICAKPSDMRCIGATCRSTGRILVQIGQLTFRALDPARYPTLTLARQVMERGGLSGCIFNAAKERD